MHAKIESVRTKGIIFGEALRTKVKKLKKNLPKSYLKTSKIPITACRLNFQNFFGEACPRIPVEPSLFLNQLQSFKVVQANKRTIKKNVEIMAPF